MGVLVAVAAGQEVQGRCLLSVWLVVVVCTQEAGRGGHGGRGDTRGSFVVLSQWTWWQAGRGEIN